MTIRSRLLRLLLPPLIAFVTLIALFFYLNWKKEIVTGFTTQLNTIVSSVSQNISGSDITWLKDHQGDADFTQQPKFQRIYKKLLSAAESLPIRNLFIINIEEVKKGEPVLLDASISSDNPKYDGKDKSLAHRQVYIMEANSTSNEDNEQPSKPKYDFSESNEQSVYYTKEPMVSQEYISRKNKEHLITGYAPLLNDQGTVQALVGADISMSEIDSKLKGALLIILASAIATISLVVLSVLVSANKISEPVQKLKNAAVDIAAGNYDSPIEVDGPSEIVELSNTLNTMSECLKENIDRLKQNAAAREHLMGEYECAVLLQERMFQRDLEQFSHPQLRIRGINTHTAMQPKGVLVNLSLINEHEVTFTFREAKEKGFEGIYRLLNEHYELNSLNVSFFLASNTATYQQNPQLPLFLWSKDQGVFLNEEVGEITWNSGDTLIAYSEGLSKLFSTRDLFEKWFSRVLRHFSQEDFDMYILMLDQEVTFLCDNHHIDQDIFIVCIQAV